MGTEPRLLDRLRAAIRARHYSLRTEDAYVQWARRYIVFHGKRHSAEMGAVEINTFLSHLAVDLNVSASTQNHALSALLPQRSRRRGAVARESGPRVGTAPAACGDDARRSAAAVRAHERIPQLVGCVLYGTGMRLMEGLRLRVKDVDFERRDVVVRRAKGAKDRRTMLPKSLSGPLRDHLVDVRAAHDADLQTGCGTVWLPEAHARKYPQAERAWAWQWVFPADRISVDPRSAVRRRHHLGEQVV